MNVGQMREAFEGLVEDSVDNALFVQWLNEAQEDVATSYSSISSAVITIDDCSQEYELPEDALKVQEIVSSTGHTYTDYIVTERGTIRFATAGTYTMYYFRMPQPLEAGDDTAEPDLPALLHTPLYIYAASMYYDKISGADEADSAMATKLLRRYEHMVARRVAKLKARKREFPSFTAGR